MNLRFYDSPGMFGDTIIAPQLRPAAYMDTFDAQGNKIAPTVMTAPAVQATPSHSMALPILAAVAAVFILKG